MARILTRGQLKARMLRALSGFSQDDFERETQVENISGIESGARRVTPDQIARMCSAAGLTPEGCEMLLQEYEARVARRAKAGAAEGPAPGPKRRPGLEHAEGMAAIVEELQARLSRAGEERRARREEERQLARSAWDRVKGLSFEDVALLARTGKEFQSWALVELICDESTRSGERAPEFAALAVEIVGHVRGSEGWCRRLRGFALAHLASAQHAAGDPGAARGTFAEAERFWKSGENPDGVLDESRFAALKASLTAPQAYPA